MSRPDGLNLFGKGNFSKVSFERKCPVGLRRAATPPNLDVVAETEGHIVAVESKCTEYMTPKAAKFSDTYRDEIIDDRREGPWFKEMMRLREVPDAYRHLDAAQLIKHAFGLANTFPDRKVVLGYLFWEPVNHRDFPLFVEHRNEIEEFSERLSGAAPELAWGSYDQIWSEWDNALGGDWIKMHVSRLRARYKVELQAPPRLG